MNVQLRKDLELYESVRPIRSLPGIDTRYDDVDLVVLRENTEGPIQRYRERGDAGSGDLPQGGDGPGIAAVREVGLRVLSYSRA